MVETMHKAAQYLQVAAQSNQNATEGAKEVALSWVKKKSSLVTADLNDHGIRLAVNYKRYAIEILTEDELLDAVSLTGESHLFICNWISEGLRRYGVKAPYSFKLDYSLPYENQLDNHFQFPAPNADKLQELIDHRNICNDALINVLSERKDATAIKVYPIHFDTHASIEVEEGEDGLSKWINVGLSIPDAQTDDFFFYAEVFSKQGEIDLSGLDEDALSSGEWYNEGWIGARLMATDINTTEAATFFDEAIQELVLVLR